MPTSTGSPCRSGPRCTDADLAGEPQPDEEGLAEPPALWLVKDDGICPMSPGLPRPTVPDSQRPAVAFAEGFDPTRDDGMAVRHRDHAANRMTGGRTGRPTDNARRATPMG